MTALRQDSRSAAEGRRILGEEDAPQTNGGGVDREAILHRRRKSSTISLLSEFERAIEPFVTPGHREAIEHFKRSCRRKLNGLTFEAVELMRLQPGESLNEAAADLAEQLSFDRTED